MFFKTVGWATNVSCMAEAATVIWCKRGTGIKNTEQHFSTLFDALITHLSQTTVFLILLIHFSGKMHLSESVLDFLKSVLSFPPKS